MGEERAREKDENVLVGKNGRHVGVKYGHRNEQWLKERVILVRLRYWRCRDSYRRGPGAIEELQIANSELLFVASRANGLKSLCGKTDLWDKIEDRDASQSKMVVAQ